MSAHESRMSPTPGWLEDLLDRLAEHLRRSRRPLSLTLTGSLAATLKMLPAHACRVGGEERPLDDVSMYVKSRRLLAVALDRIGSSAAIADE